VVGTKRRTCCETQCVIALQGHLRSLILATIESAYASSYWSSIVTLGPILSRFRDIVGFLRRATPHLFHRNFRGVPFGLDCRCCGSEERRPKLIIRVIAFELTQHIRPRYLNVTDRQTDGRTTYDTNTALALPASRGKNRPTFTKVITKRLSWCFYRAMHVVLARYCYRKSSVRPSVCPSVRP